MSTACELAYCTGDHERVDEMAAQVVADAKSAEDMMRVKMAQIISCSARGRVEAGIETGLGMLKMLGEPYPRRCSRFSVFLEFYRLRRSLRDKSEEDILSLPKLEDPRVVASMQIIFILFPLIALSELSLSPMPAFRLVRLTLKHGLSAMGKNKGSIELSALTQISNVFASTSSRNCIQPLLCLPCPTSGL